MKTIPSLSPTLREKKRYLTYEVISDQPMMYTDYSSGIHEQLVRFLGELGCAHAGLQFVNPEVPQRGVIRMNHTVVDRVRAGLALVKKIKNTNVIVRSITVSGMLRNALSTTIEKRRH